MFYKVIAKYKNKKNKNKFYKRIYRNTREFECKKREEFIYFLTMRIICIFNISKLEEKDYFYSIFIYYKISTSVKAFQFVFLHYLYENISDDIYNSLNIIINIFESI